MEQQIQSDSQGSMQFGEVDPPENQIIENDGSDNCQSSTEQEGSSINQTQQPKPTIVNYGACIICNINTRCVLFVGCNHLACCGQCSTACNDVCPVPDCNHRIEKRLHVFKP